MGCRYLYCQVFQYRNREGERKYSLGTADKPVLVVDIEGTWLIEDLEQQFFIIAFDCG